MTDEKIFERELLSDDELEHVTGGTNYIDTTLFNKIIGGQNFFKRPTDDERLEKFKYPRVD